jgi:phosphomannomutase
MDVASIDDLAAGYHGLPATDGIRLGLGETEYIVAARIICRPSGTEPKLKCYVEVVVPVGESMDVARDVAQTMIDGIKTDLAATLGL